MTNDNPGFLRARMRRGELTGHTTGLAPGFVQVNIAILPHGDAAGFAEYCRRNAQACPVLAISRPGEPSLPGLGEDIDIRTDLPRYRVCRDGVTTEATDVRDIWRNDLVTFAIGCSFTFDAALCDAGLVPRHVARGRNVAMYRTTTPTVAAGRFHGPLVVSMRPFLPADAARAAAISARHPDMHGAPVHIGDPAELGIRDIARPDYGDPVGIKPGEAPVFWACGVTSQTALQAASLSFFIAHAPGCMLLTDRPRRTAA